VGLALFFSVRGALGGLPVASSCPFFLSKARLKPVELLRQDIQWLAGLRVMVYRGEVESPLTPDVMVANFFSLEGKIFNQVTLDSPDFRLWKFALSGSERIREVLYNELILMHLLDRADDRCSAALWYLVRSTRVPRVLLSWLFPHASGVQSALEGHFAFMHIHYFLDSSRRISELVAFVELTFDSAP